MTVSRIFLTAACALAFACPAEAQTYPGQDVTVNPNAAGNGRVVIYPGGRYVQLPPLLQPGQPYPGTQAQPIHLHMPTPHHRRHRAVVRKETPPPEENVATAPPPAPAPVVRRKSPRPQPEATADNSTDTSTDTSDDTSPAPASAIPFSFGGPMPQQQPHRRHGKSSLLPPVRTPRVNPHAAARRTSHVAAIAPSRTESGTTIATRAPMTPGEEGPDLSKRSEILFPHNGTSPSPQSASHLRQLASELNSALNAGARRVQLDAFGGAPGDKSSDARRVSLKRALVVRQLLINDGVPASRIDVRAMGGIDDNGNADRVDVYVRAG